MPGRIVSSTADKQCCLRALQDTRRALHRRRIIANSVNTMMLSLTASKKGPYATTLQSRDVVLAPWPLRSTEKYHQQRQTNISRRQQLIGTREYPSRCPISSDECLSRIWTGMGLHAPSTQYRGRVLRVFRIRVGLWRWYCVTVQVQIYITAVWQLFMHSVQSFILAVILVSADA